MVVVLFLEERGAGLGYPFSKDEGHFVVREACHAHRSFGLNLFVDCLRFSEQGWSLLGDSTAELKPWS